MFGTFFFLNWRKFLWTHTISSPLGKWSKNFWELSGTKKVKNKLGKLYAEICKWLRCNREYRCKLKDTLACDLISQVGFPPKKNLNLSPQFDFSVHVWAPKMGQIAQKHTARVPQTSFRGVFEGKLGHVIRPQISIFGQCDFADQ